MSYNTILLGIGGRLLRGENWTYNNQEIEIVDEFNYLGTIFKYTGSFS